MKSGHLYLKTFVSASQFHIYHLLTMGNTCLSIRAQSFGWFVTRNMWQTCGEAVLVEDQRVQLSILNPTGQKVYYVPTTAI